MENDIKQKDTFPDQEFEIIDHARSDSLHIHLVEITSRRPHSHSDLEICLLLRGELHVHTDEGQFLLRKNDILVMNRYQTHAFSQPTGDDLLFSCQINSHLYRNEDPSLRYLYFENTIIRSGHLHDLLLEMLLECAEHYFKGEEHFTLICSSLCLKIIYTLIRNTHCHILTEKEYAATRKASERLNRISEDSNAHHTEHISLEDIAALEHISTYHASHMFRQDFGVSFQEYLNNIRFEHAYRLIETTDFSILDICMETGFSSSRYLNQMFEKRLGMSAAAYRKAKEKPAFRTTSIPSRDVENWYSQSTSYEVICRIREERKSGAGKQEIRK